MRNSRAPLIVVASLIALTSPPFWVHSAEKLQQPAPSRPQETEASIPRKNVRHLVYQPPRRGAPSIRVGGGTRGEGANLPAVYVLVPEHTGLTVRTQPDLFWYSSGPITVKLEFALIDDRSIDPILETSLEPTRSAGIRRIRLSAHGIELSPRVEYQWSVFLIQEPGQRSRDLVTSGRIEYVQLSPALATEVENATPRDLPFIYAREGLWYDALAMLSELIDAAPGDSTLREYRADLLEQVGLRDVATAERKQRR